VAPDKPVRKQRPVLALESQRKSEEVADDCATATCRAAAARPCAASGEIDTVVASDLFTGPDVPPGDEVAAGAVIAHPGVGIAAVVHVAVWKAEQNHFAVGVVTVVGPLAEVLSQRRVGGHLANNCDLPDPFACANRTMREDA